MPKNKETHTKEPQSIVLSQSRAMLSSADLLVTPPDQLTDQEAVIAWSVLDHFEKEMLKKRRDALRDRLLDLAKAKGKLTGKSYVYAQDGIDGSVSCQMRSGVISYDIEGLRALENRIDTPLVTEVVTYKVNEELLTEALAQGRITMDDLKKFTSVGPETRALVVKKPSFVKALLPGASDD